MGVEEKSSKVRWDFNIKKNRLLKEGYGLGSKLAIGVGISLPNSRMSTLLPLSLPLLELMTNYSFTIIASLLWILKAFHLKEFLFETQIFVRWIIPYTIISKLHSSYTVEQERQ